MKTLIRNLLLVLIIGFSILMISSCEKDKEKAVDTVDLLLGTWNFGESNIEITNGADEFTLFLSTSYNISADSAQAILDLYVSDNIEVDDTGGSLSVYSDQTYKIISDDSNEMGNWTKSSDGKILTIKYENEDDQILTIKELTNTSLVLVVPMESVYFDLDDNGSEETSLDMEMVLSLSINNDKVN